jgi:hypothetical protein
VVAVEQKHAHRPVQDDVVAAPEGTAEPACDLVFEVVAPD